MTLRLDIERENLQRFNLLETHDINGSFLYLVTKVKYGSKLSGQFRLIRNMYVPKLI